MSDPRKISGFTLLELLVVISLLAMIAGIVAANLQRGSTSAQLNSQTRQLMALLRQTRTRALSESQILVMSAGEDGTRYRVGPSEEDVALPEGFSVAIQSNTQVQGFAQNQILFYPDGSSSGGQIEMHSPAGDAEIDVNWLTGEVSLVAPAQ